MKVLVDLKPAFDGYAGIPQEARILFHGLLSADSEIEAHGLLQHPRATLVGAEGIVDKKPDERIFRSAQTIVSSYEEPPRGRLGHYRRTYRNLVELTRLRWRAHNGRALALGHFDAKYFDDFLWDRLFSKTLHESHKCDIAAASFRTVGPGRGMMQRAGLAPFYRGRGRRFVRLDTCGYDYLICHTPLPAEVSNDTQLVIRYHDSVPVFMPHTIENRAVHLSAHYFALKSNVEQGAIFVCNSEATREDLLTLFPQIKDRTTVIYNAIPDRFDPHDSLRMRARAIIAQRQSYSEGEALVGQDEIPADFLLMVSTLEPRKNHAMLIAAWERMQENGQQDLGLVLVGSKGWEHAEIEALMYPWKNRRRLFHLSNVPAEELCILYREAVATVCPSRSEGFDYSGVEAMRNGGVVAASDISVHREVYGKAAVYFSPYSVRDAAETIRDLITSSGNNKRNELRNASQAVLERYRASNVLDLWRDFLLTTKH